MHLLDLPDDALISLATHLDSPVAIGQTCRRLHVLLLAHLGTRAHVFLRSRGTQAVLALMLKDSRNIVSDFRHHYDLFLAILQRPKFLSFVADNERLDIVSAGISVAILHPSRRADVTTWSALLPPRKIVETRQLLWIFQTGDIEALRQLRASGAWCRIPNLEEPLRLIPGSFEEDIGEFLACLKSFGPLLPTAIDMNAEVASYALLEAYLEYYRPAWHRKDCAKHLRNLYQIFRTGDMEDRRYFLLRSFDPLDQVPVPELRSRLMECLDTAKQIDGVNDQIWEEISSIVENGRVELLDLGREFLCSSLSPTIDSRIAAAVIESLLPHMCTIEGRAFFQRLYITTTLFWDSLRDHLPWDSFLTLGKNHYLYRETFNAISRRIA